MINSFITFDNIQVRNKGAEKTRLLSRTKWRIFECLEELEANFNLKTQTILAQSNVYKKHIKYLLAKFMEFIMYIIFIEVLQFIFFFLYNFLVDFQMRLHTFDMHSY